MKANPVLFQVCRAVLAGTLSGVTRPGEPQLPPEQLAESRRSLVEGRLKARLPQVAKSFPLFEETASDLRQNLIRTAPDERLHLLCLSQIYQLAWELAKTTATFIPGAFAECAEIARHLALNQRTASPSSIEDESVSVTRNRIFSVEERPLFQKLFSSRFKSSLAAFPTKRDFAKKSDLSPPTLYKMSAGKDSTFKTLFKAASALEYPLKEMFILGPAEEEEPVAASLQSLLSALLDSLSDPAISPPPSLRLRPDFEHSPPKQPALENRVWKLDEWPEVRDLLHREICGLISAAPFREKEFAALAGLSPVKISHLKNGVYQPKIFTLFGIACASRLPPYKLFEFRNGSLPKIR